MLQFTDWELQARLIYALVVAGKSAKFAEKVVRRLFSFRELPFDTIKDWVQWGMLGSYLLEAKTGNYLKLTKALSYIAEHNINLRTCSAEDLELIPGVGPKTSRFFILWTREEANYAALDVHILRWLREQGYLNIPKATPSWSRYQQIEQLFLEEARKKGMTPRELDKQIWMAGSQYGQYNPDFSGGKNEHQRLKPQSVG